jgi:S-formylglutathione hydrolase FrmB
MGAAMRRSLLTVSLALTSALAVGCSKPSLAPAPAPTTGSPPPTAPNAPAAPAAAPGIAAPSRVVTERFHSEALGVDKSVVVYLPRGYDEKARKRYPVFLYLHGLGGDERNWIEGGKLDAAADQLGLEAIVVMPDGDDDFYINTKLPIEFDACMNSGAGLFMPGRQDPASTCVRARDYETYISKDLLAWVDGRYHTLATREGRAIAGLSMGGFGAMELALRHPELFSAAASHSGAVGLIYRGPHPYQPGKAELAKDVASWSKGAGPLGPWLRGVFGDDLAGWKRYDVVELAGALPPGKVALYFDCGTEDDFRLHDNLQYVHEQLTARHIPHEFFLGPGAHNFEFWRARVPFSLAFLRDHTAQAQ